MNRIEQLFKTKKNILSIFFTAGYPNLSDTAEIIHELEKSGVDLIEIGMPFSDPLADGQTIQLSSQKAIENGMTLKLLFEQLSDIRKTVTIPLVLMGYLNTVMQFGIENFCHKCKETGIDGVILPDLPIDEFKEKYESIFKENGLKNIFLITPQTSEERIRMIDNADAGLIYMVSSSSTTGKSSDFNDEQIQYFKRINSMNLKTPRVIGFGISNKRTFTQACEYADGAIIGSAFVKAISESSNHAETIKEFIEIY